MKIQCEENMLRVRINEFEYNTLIENGVYFINLPYLPLMINIQQNTSEKCSILCNQQLLINLTKEQIILLNEPQNLKNGIELWLTATNSGNITLIVQIDMFKSKNSKQI